jgi:hypothetical protein
MPPTEEKSARKRIKNALTVSVKRAEQVAPRRCLIAFDWATADGRLVEVSDVYEVKSAKVMTTLLLASAGRRVHAVLQPDGPDKDVLPDCTSAVEQA